MIIRRAEIKDFNAFKDLYSNIEYQWLYKSEDNEPSDNNLHQILFELGIDEDFIDEIESSYSNYSFENFLEDKENIFIIEEEKSVITGYILFHNSRKFFRIMEWGMKKINLDKIQEIVDYLEKKFPRKRIELFAGRYAEQYLLSVGFQRENGGELSKKEAV